jgi:hypothetical protein
MLCGRGRHAKLRYFLARRDEILLQIAQSDFLSQVLVAAASEALADLLLWRDSLDA